MKVSLKGIQSERWSFWVYIPCYQLIITRIYDVSFHTFPFRTFFGAKIFGAGMGGRDMATLIPSPMIGV